MKSILQRSKLSGPLPVRLFDADYQQLRKLACAKDRKIASLVRKAVREYLAAKQSSPESLGGFEAGSPIPDGYLGEGLNG